MTCPARVSFLSNLAQYSHFCSLPPQFNLTVATVNEQYARMTDLWYSISTETYPTSRLFPNPLKSQAVRGRIWR